MDESFNTTYSHIRRILTDGNAEAKEVRLNQVERNDDEDNDGDDSDEAGDSDDATVAGRADNMKDNGEN